MESPAGKATQEPDAMPPGPRLPLSMLLLLIWTTRLRSWLLVLLPLLAGVLLWSSTYVIPWFSTLYDELLPGERLPLLTLGVFAAQRFMAHFWLPVLGLFAGLLALPSAMGFLVRRRYGPEAMPDLSFLRVSMLGVYVSAVLGLCFLGTFLAFAVFQPLWRILCWGEL